MPRRKALVRASRYLSQCAARRNGGANGTNELKTTGEDHNTGQQATTGAGASDASRGSGSRPFLAGVRAAFRVPGFVLFATSIGFGALARDAQLHIGQSLAVAAAFYALPAQVVFVDQIARGAGLLAAAFLVTLTAIRFLPMTVSLVPLLRGPRTRSWQIFAAVHLVAITTWVESHRTLPSLAPDARLAYFVGLGLGVIVFTWSGTAVGYYGAAELPPVLSATLLFVTPIYFLLSLIGPSAVRIDYLAVLLGAVLGPIFYRLVPGFDLLVTGLVGGTAAFLLARRKR